MIKIRMPLFVFIPLFITSWTQASQLNCNQIIKSSQRIDIQMGAKHLSLIGWEHPDTEGVLQFYKDMKQLYKLGEDKKCVKAQLLAKTMRLKLDKDISHSRRAYSLLISSHQEHHIEFIGTETTEEEERDLVPQVTEQIYYGLAIIKDNCPNISTDMIEDLNFYGIGPDKMFAMSNSPINFVGLEDPVERKKATLLATEITSDNGFPDQLTSATSKVQEKIRKDIEAGKLLLQEDIEAAVKGEPDSKKALAIKHALESLQELLAHARVRNKKIVENLNKQHFQNGAILIGLTHIPDIADQLIKGCQKNFDH